MVKKAYLKSLGRLFIRHIIRLLSISAIFVVTVSLISGLGDVQGNIKKSIIASYQEDNIHDVTVRSYSTIVEEVISYIDSDPEYYGVDKHEEVYTYDMYDQENDRYAKRNIFMNFENYKDKKDAIDKLELIDGRFPTPGANEVVVERSTKDINYHEIGSTITSKIEYEVEIGGEIYRYEGEVKDAVVVGIVKNPTMVALTREPSIFFLEGDGKHLYLNDVYYFPDTMVQAGSDLEDLGQYPSSLLTLKDRNLFNCFSETYKDAVTILKTKIQDASWNFSISYSLMDDNFSLWSLNMYADKVGVLATIFIVFFILIAILVVYSTMSRLLDEERGSMAVLKTLGYSNFAIAVRYLLFALVAGGIGIGLSVIPAKIVNSLILNAFGIQYAMKAIAFPVVGPFFFILAFTILVLSLGLTLIKSITTANHSPVELLTPRAPKVGKKIVLERIKAIWTRLSFKYKSTYRNVFLFKARFVMTVLSIMAATVLVFASFALLNNANKMQGFDSLQTISLLLLVFSAALCALVIYNITNINISERTREIATLMVLGYRNHEVTGYIYREIYILTAIGAVLGLPAGVGFIIFVFDYIGTFELANIEWWAYLVSPLITFLFALLATRLLHMKIVKTDMNESLKVLE